MVGERKSRVSMGRTAFPISFSRIHRSMGRGLVVWLWRVRWGLFGGRPWSRGWVCRYAGLKGLEVRDCVDVYSVGSNVQR